ncbi:MAG TPA: polysaccharide biosynthesis tyrosine autokinase [Chitinophagaceae bacterium]
MEATNGQLARDIQKKQALSPREFILRYLKYLPWIILSLALALVFAKIKLRYAVPVYKAEARLLIKREAPGRGNDRFDEIFSGSSIQNVFNEMELLKSRPLAARVAKLLNLQSYCINLGNIRNTLLYREAPIDIQLLPPLDSNSSFSVELTVIDNNRFRIKDQQKQYNFGETISYGGATFRVVKLVSQVHNLYASNEYVVGRRSPESAAELVTGGLRVALVDNFAQVITLTYESQNPRMAQDILNTLMLVYKESNIEDKQQMRIFTLQFIDERLDSLRVELGIVEKDLTRFVESNRAIDLNKQSQMYLERMNQEASSQTQQEIRMSILDYLIRYLSNNANAWNVVPVELGTQEPTLVPLITQYNQLQQERQNALATMPAANPFVINLDDRITKLRADIVEALRNVRQSYLITKNNLQRESGRMEQRLQSIPSKGQQLAERQRQQKIKEELYLFLLQKKEETAIASASTISDSKIVEPARTGSSPISPNSKSIYMVAMVFGLAVPIGLIVLIEFFNDKVKNKADIERITDTPFIGEIGHSEGKEVLVVTQNSRRFISEQFRIIRTNLQFLLNKVEKPVIMITSSFSGEGKSFVSTNIGAVMALTGKRTVIMEMDIRKPKVVANLELKKKMGITNYIVGHVKLDQIIIPVPEVENLFVIPCGPLPPNPAEMLLDPKLQELFEQVRKEFDVVIVDTAPVGLVSDAMVISQYVDCSIFILRQGYTYKKQISLIDELYTSKKLPRMSLLLNDVKVGAGYGGYYSYGNYGYGYGYAYGGGYFEEEGKKRKKKKNLLDRVTGIFKT